MKSILVQAFVSILSLILMNPVGSTNASTAVLDPVPSLCAQGGIHSIRVHEGFTQVPPGDLCLKPDTPVSRTLIGQFSDLNRKSAEALRLSLVEAIGPLGVKIEILPSAWGLLASDGGPGYLKFGLPPNWAGTPISPTVYVHELGHLINFMQRDTSATSPLKRLAKFPSSSWFEAIPDSLAYMVTGKASFALVPGEAQDADPCFLENLRPFLALSTFDLPPKNFIYPLTRQFLLDACCSNVQRLDQQRADSCARVERGMAEDLNPSYPSSPGSWGDVWRAELKLALSSSAPRRMDLNAFYRFRHSVDAHAFGVPIVLFLRDLEQASDIPMATFFVNALWATSSAPTSASLALRCTGYDSGTKVVFEYLATPAPDLIAEIQRQLPNLSPEKFASIARMHGIDNLNGIENVNAIIFTENQNYVPMPGISGLRRCEFATPESNRGATNTNQ